MEEDEEDDFMSAKFIIQTEPIKPVSGRDLQFNVSSAKSLKSRQREMLEEGLANPMSKESKGFKLLEKMGFKSGMALGKSQNGIIEPISINLNQSKTGLGMIKHKKEIAIDAKRKSDSVDADNLDDYRARKASKMQLERDYRDVQNARKICEQLDCEQKSLRSMFWILEELTSIPVDEETQPAIDTFATYELDLITGYLRKTHFFCLWCGERFADLVDINSICPGATREDHDE